MSSFPSFSDTASHGMGIASRAMKLVATGATSSFGRAERFAEESRNRRKVRIDRFYDVDGGNKCSLAKSVRNSLYGSAMAHNKAPRFPRPSPQLAQPDTVGPGSYNSNPFDNIVAQVNSSHHIVSTRNFLHASQKLILNRFL